MERKRRKQQKKAEMQRLCRLLDIKDWHQNEKIAQEVRAIIQKEKQVKGEAAKERPTQNKEQKSRKNKNKTTE